MARTPAIGRLLVTVALIAVALIAGSLLSLTVLAGSHTPADAAPLDHRLDRPRGPAAHAARTADAARSEQSARTDHAASSRLVQPPVTLPADTSDRLAQPRPGLVAAQSTRVAETVTPTTDRPGPDIPAPAECQVDPLPLPIEVAPPLGEVTPPPAQPTAFAIPTGDSVDEATVDAVSRVVRESVACRNAGDFLRAYALFTDAFLARLLGPPDAIDPDLVARLAVPPTPVSADDQLAVGALTDVVRLPDGRVGAIVHTQDATTVYADYLYFLETDTGWRIDARVYLADTRVATPPA